MVRRGWRGIVGAVLAIGLFSVACSAGAVPAIGKDGAKTQLVSRASGPSGRPIAAAQAGTISADGRYATFVAKGSEIFVRDLRAERTRRIGEGGSPVLSANGRFLAYNSDGKVFVSDLRTRARSVASEPLPALKHEATGLGFSSNPSISSNGRFVTFESYSRGLVDEDGNHRPDQGYPPYQVYLRDLKTKTTTLISRAKGANGAVGNGESSNPAISSNGRFVAFVSAADNLLPGAPEPGYGVYVRDLRTGNIRRVSYWHSKPGPHRSDVFRRPAISANGRYVAFVFNRTGGLRSVVVRDLRTDTTVNASLLTQTPLKLGSAAPAISGNGRFVAFSAGYRDQRLYLVDLRTRRTRFIHAVSPEGEPLSLSASGRYLLFDTFVDSNVPKGTEPLVPARGEVYRYTNLLARR